MKRRVEDKTSRSGYAMMLALLLMFIGSSVTALIYRNSLQSLHQVKRNRESDQALLAAQSAIEQVKVGILDKYKEYYYEKSRHFHQQNNWFNLRQNKKIGTAGIFYEIPDRITIGHTTVEIIDITGTAFNLNAKGTSECLITFTAQATVGGVTRTVKETVKCSFGMSNIFKYAYFLNNFGWFHEVPLTINGDIRSNHIMEIKNLYGQMLLNGSGESASDFNIEGKAPGSWNKSQYQKNASGFARPLENGGAWNNGYNPNNREMAADQDKLPMPYLGDLQEYIEYAAHQKGKVKQGGTTIVDTHYEGGGHNTSPLVTADDGTLVLIGTLENPIEINGPVVVDSDLVIGGYITGQGSFYVGRNVHIVHDVKYVNPPQWDKPLTDAKKTIKETSEADFLGLCAKGSVILGDYTSSSFDWLQKYMGAENGDPGGFNIPSYETDPSDTCIGYGEFELNGNPAFDGNYTESFGEKPNPTAGNPSGTEPRPYYSSSLSDNDFLSLNPSFSIGQIDAVI
ncbi:MAG: hypothetical protein ABFR47_04910, partial [Verrucomicrobiota bacterium]